MYQAVSCNKLVLPKRRDREIYIDAGEDGQVDRWVHRQIGKQIKRQIRQADGVKPASRGKKRKGGGQDAQKNCFVPPCCVFVFCKCFGLVMPNEDAIISVLYVFSMR